MLFCSAIEIEKVKVKIFSRTAKKKTNWRWENIILSKSHLRRVLNDLKKINFEDHFSAGFCLSSYENLYFRLSEL